MYCTQRAYIRTKAEEYGHVCKTDLEAYTANAQKLSIATGINHLNKDGYPNLGKQGNKHPDDDKIRFWLAARREDYKSKPHFGR